jgi:hypothetical protein
METGAGPISTRYDEVTTGAAMVTEAITPTQPLTTEQPITSLQPGLNNQNLNTYTTLPLELQHIDMSQLLAPTMAQMQHFYAQYATPQQSANTIQQHQQQQPTLQHHLTTQSPNYIAIASTTTTPQQTISIPHANNTHQTQHSTNLGANQLAGVKTNTNRSKMGGIHSKINYNPTVVKNSLKPNTQQNKPDMNVNKTGIKRPLLPTSKNAKQKKVLTHKGYVNQLTQSLEATANHTIHDTQRTVVHRDTRQPPKVLYVPDTSDDTRMVSVLNENNMSIQNVPVSVPHRTQVDQTIPHMKPLNTYHQQQYQQQQQQQQQQHYQQYIQQQQHIQHLQHQLQQQQQLQLQIQQQHQQQQQITTPRVTVAVANTDVFAESDYITTPPQVYEDITPPGSDFGGPDDETLPDIRTSVGNVLATVSYIHMSVINYI